VPNKHSIFVPSILLNWCVLDRSGAVGVFLWCQRPILSGRVVFGFSNCSIWIFKFYYLPKLLLG